MYHVPYFLGQVDLTLNLRNCVKKKGGGGGRERKLQNRAGSDLGVYFFCRQSVQIFKEINIPIYER